MRKLLLPTDFSENANNALAYAVALANAFGCELTLLHVYEVYSTAGSFVSVESFMQKDAAEEMLAIINKTEPFLKNNTRIDSKIIKGNTVDIITKVAEQQDYDLIIMGTQGASGLEEIFIGSNTNAVIKNTKLPVLAVPESFTFRPIQTIVLTVDESEDFNAEVLSPLLQIAKNYGAMVRIYHKDVARDGLNAAIDPYLKDIERTYHYELDAENINESINEFVAEYQPDLLCMIRRKRSFLEKVFHDSVTSNEVFHSPLPLLILQDM